MVPNLSFSTKPRIGCMCKKLSFYGVLGRCGHDRKNILRGSSFKPDKRVARSQARCLGAKGARPRI
jgi:hypothetical protein